MYWSKMECKSRNWNYEPSLTACNRKKKNSGGDAIKKDRAISAKVCTGDIQVQGQLLYFYILFY